MSLKLFLQLGVIGAKIMGRVAVDSYRQMAKSFQKNLTKAPTPSSAMDLDEALKILNLQKGTPKEEMIARYQKMFGLNDRKEGGSFYLQSKIVRARERLEAEYQREAMQKPE